MDTRVVMAFGAWGSATNMDYCHDIHTSKEGREGGGCEDISLISNSLWSTAFSISISEHTYKTPLGKVW